MKQIFILVFVLFCSIYAQAQKPPTEAQIRKDVMNPGVIAIIFRGSGSYEKYVTNGAVVNEYYRSITVRRKTDKPGVTLDVIGDVVYRLIGGRWVYRTMRLAGNQYGGIKNPTVAEINQALESSTARDFDSNRSIIGEFESMKISDDPMWEWHTPNSVSFNVVAVFRNVYKGGSYTGESSPAFRPGFEIVDKVQAILRLRIYRKDEQSPWNNVAVRRFRFESIYNSKKELVRAEKLLERREYPESEVKQMPTLSKAPLLTQ